MTAVDLTDRCPTWCQDHHHEEDCGWVEHEAIVGAAGPIEVVLQCFVIAGQPDPVTQLVLSGEGGHELVVPLDAANGLAEALQRAVATAG